ncbi:hypothetical protein [Archangium violaceum]|uniref:hypothetical protein n=1 Tax=Archangium violaceum TaxID=83451 RepID=UPI001F275462|nr:hypothetical protein [Archangium violaceum]
MSTPARAEGGGSGREFAGPVKGARCGTLDDEEGGGSGSGLRALGASDAIVPELEPELLLVAAGGVDFVCGVPAA